MRRRCCVCDRHFELKTALANVRSRARATKSEATRRPDRPTATRPSPAGPPDRERPRTCMRARARAAATPPHIKHTRGRGQRLPNFGHILPFRPARPHSGEYLSSKLGGCRRVCVTAGASTSSPSRSHPCADVLAPLISNELVQLLGNIRPTQEAHK